MSPTVLTPPGREQNYGFLAYLALKTALYSFSRSKQALVRRLLGVSTRLETLYKSYNITPIPGIPVSQHRSAKTPSEPPTGSLNSSPRPRPKASIFLSAPPETHRPEYPRPALSPAGATPPTLIAQHTPAPLSARPAQTPRHSPPRTPPPPRARRHPPPAPEEARKSAHRATPPGNR